MTATNMFNLRLPNLRYGRLYWVLFVGITLLILYSAVMHKKSSFAETTIVDVIPLEGGNKLISESDVRQALLRGFGNTLEGTELGRLDVERMERVLEEDPFVEKAETYVDQRNNLHVRIRQRAPLLRILDNNGGNYYLDKNGVKMPPSKNFTARVIVGTGNIAPYVQEFKQKKRNTLKDIYTLTNVINNDAFLSNFIQQIHVNNAGEFILVPLIGDQKILIGSVKRLDDKIKRLKTFYKEGMPYTGWREYATINVKYAGQVVCKR
jgi:cell division protein FtsQ